MRLLTYDSSISLTCSTAACESKMPQRNSSHRDTEALSPECRAYPQHAWRLLHAAPHMAAALSHTTAALGKMRSALQPRCVDHKAPTIRLTLHLAPLVRALKRAVGARRSICMWRRHNGAGPTDMGYNRCIW